MKSTIILHGMPSRGEFDADNKGSQFEKHWMPWLKNELERGGIIVYGPALPEPYDPDYAKWSTVFERLPLSSDTMLVGHSCGAGFLLRWLSEHHVSAGKLALVAPFLDPDHEAPKMSLFDFRIDPQITTRVANIRVFYSTDDMPSIQTSVEQIRHVLPTAEFEEFSDRGHFTLGDMGTEQFPELLSYLL